MMLPRIVSRPCAALSRASRGVIIAALCLSASDSLLSAPAQAQVVLNPANNHYYQRVASGIDWAAANAAASTSVYLGRTGYLATVTSQSETDFLVASFGGPELAGLSVGGYQQPNQSAPDAGWQWVTGEAYSYANWNGGDPNDGGSFIENNIENGLQFAWNASDGSWNDIPFSPSINFGYLVEYSPSVTDVPEPGVVAFGIVSALGVCGLLIRKRREA